MKYRILPPSLLALALVSMLSGPALATRIDDPGVGVLAPPASTASSVPEAMATTIREQVERLGATQSLSLQTGSILREVIAGDVVHYTIAVRTGPGKYDQIRVHRVVRETRPGIPIRTPLNLFYQHGDIKDFTGMLLPGLYEPSMARDFGAATFLARNNVDVWGIDQDWTLVPETETDLSFMSTWGLGRAMNNLQLGVGLARALRLVTGSGGDPMLLAGYSSGGYVAAALLDRETQLPALLRQVKGYINVDIPLKPGDPGIRAALLADLANQDASIAGGQFGAFQPFRLMAQLASTAPDDASPIFAGFTNYQAIAYLTIAPGGTGWSAPIHYWAGNLAPDGIPTGPRLTTKANWLEFLEATIVWQPAAFFKEYDEFALAPLNGLASPFDDHLAAVRVPVLNIVPAGGLSGTTQNGMSVFGSTDVQEIFPTTGSAPETDIGHVDLFTWSGSQEMVWRPMLGWIVAHSGSRRPLAIGEFSAQGPMGEAADPAVVPAPTMELGIRRIAPNPVSGPFNLQFSLPTAATARVEVLDIAGRILESQDLAMAGDGPGQARLGVTKRLAPGIYMVRLSQAGLEWSKRIAVVR
jgi:hypothetical protein